MESSENEKRFRLWGQTVTLFWTILPFGKSNSSPSSLLQITASSILNSLFEMRMQRSKNKTGQGWTDNWFRLMLRKLVAQCKMLTTTSEPMFWYVAHGSTENTGRLTRSNQSQRKKSRLTASSNFAIPFVCHCEEFRKLSSVCKLPSLPLITNIQAVSRQ